MEKVYRKYALKRVSCSILILINSTKQPMDSTNLNYIYIYIYIYICVCVYISSILINIIVISWNISWKMLRFLRSNIQLRLQFLLNLWWPDVHIRNQKCNIWRLQYFGDVLGQTNIACLFCRTNQLTSITSKWYPLKFFWNMLSISSKTLFICFQNLKIYFVSLNHSFPLCQVLLENKIEIKS